MSKVKKQKPTLTQEQAWGFDGLMVTAAFRYCCGRSSYIVGTCVDWLVDNWETFPENVRQVIERDLEEKFIQDNEARKLGEQYKPLGWDMDRKEWERVRALYMKETANVA